MAGTWVAWVIAVAFGYVANKLFVFKTHCADTGALLLQAGSFFAMRLVSLGMETVLMFLLVEVTAPRRSGNEAAGEHRGHHFELCVLEAVHFKKK